MSLIRVLEPNYSTVSSFSLVEVQTVQNFHDKCLLMPFLSDGKTTLGDGCTLPLNDYVPSRVTSTCLRDLLYCFDSRAQARRLGWQHPAMAAVCVRMSLQLGASDNGYAVAQRRTTRRYHQRLKIEPHKALFSYTNADVESPFKKLTSIRD